MIFIWFYFWNRSFVLKPRWWEWGTTFKSALFGGMNTTSQHSRWNYITLWSWWPEELKKEPVHLCQVKEDNANCCRLEHWCHLAREDCEALRVSVGADRCTSYMLGRVVEGYGVSPQDLGLPTRRTETLRSLVDVWISSQPCEVLSC